MTAVVETEDVAYRLAPASSSRSAAVVSRRTIQGVAQETRPRKAPDQVPLCARLFWLDGFDGPVCQWVWSGVDTATFFALAPGCRGRGLPRYCVVSLEKNSPDILSGGVSETTEWQQKVVGVERNAGLW